MADESAANEGSTIGGQQIVFEAIVEGQSALASLARTLSTLQEQARRGAITVDLQVTGAGGAGGGIAGELPQIIERAAQSARFNWKAIARPEELEAVLRSVEPQLTRLAQQAEEAGKAINMAVTGSSGSGSAYRLSSRNDVPGFIESVRQHGRSIAGGRDRDITLSGGMDFQPSESGLGDVAGVQGAMAQAHAIGQARQQAVKDERDALRLKMMDDKQASRELNAEEKARVASAAAAEKAALADQRDTIRLRAMEDKEAQKQLDAEERAKSQERQRQQDLATRLSPLTRGQYTGLATWKPEDEEGERANELRRMREGITNRLSRATPEEKAEERERKESIREIERERKERERLNAAGGWMDRFAFGQRPQRVIGEALTSMGASPAAAGLGAFVGGGMLFHLGWEITNQLAKIPDRIAQQVEQYRAYEMQRASMLIPSSAAGQAMAKFNPNATLSSEQTLDALMSSYGAYAQRIRGGGGKTLEEFQAQLANLQTTGVQDMSTPEQAQQALRDNARYLAIASLLHEVNPTSFGDPYQTAYNLQLLESTRGAEGRAMLANNEALMPIMTAEFRKKYPHLALQDEKSVRAAVKQALEYPTTLPGGQENPYAISPQEAMNVVEQYASSPQVTEMARERMATQTWAEWWNQWHMVYDPRGELTNIEAGAVGDYGTRIRDKGRPLTDEEREQYRQEMSRTIYFNSLNGTEFSAEARREKIDAARVRSKELMPLAESFAGIDPNAMLKLSGKPFEAPLPGPASFSFSSLSGFANKMQTEAGVQIDFAKDTANNTKRMADALEALVPNLGKPGAAGGGGGDPAF